MTNTDSELIRLFEEPLSATARGRRGIPSFALSTFLHGFGIAAIGYVLLHNPAIVQIPANRAYKLRHLDFKIPETAATRAAEAAYPTRDPGPAIKRTASAENNPKQAAQVQPRLHILPALKLPEGGSGKQILLQPEIPQKQLLALKTPIPTVLLWQPEVKPTVKIVAPRSQVSTAEAQVSIQLPNEEMKLADLPVTASPKLTQLPAPAAGTSSPVSMKTPSTVTAPPATVSATDEEPAPAAVLSVSDLRMNVGTAVLAPANETRGTEQKEGGAPQGGSLLTARTDSGAPAQGDGGAKASDAPKEAASTAATLDPGKPLASVLLDNQTAGETAEHIQLPKDGKFGVIVVGSDLSDRYPETLQIWADRTAYTAYLHVGTAKAWILQYAQLRSTDESSQGVVAKLEAPWPYDIERPNLLTKDLNADALMVRGVLTASGRLENMAVAYPTDYAHSGFVLRELAQWLFRPAQQLGKPTAVEVLLIIPEEVD
ncbi:MAG TPA: hypothetical protein VGJ21_21690 [Terracidiphilus sp.]